MFCCCLAAGRIRGFTISLCLNAGTTIQRLTLFLNVLYFSACYGYKRSTESYLAAIDLGWAGLHVDVGCGSTSSVRTARGGRLVCFPEGLCVGIFHVIYVLTDMVYKYDVYIV